jgi:hypothetical protein
MNGSIDAGLLFDLAKLVHKHGPEAIENLGILLASPEFTSELSRVLRETGIHGKRLGVANKPSSFAGIRGRISEHASTDPERGMLLSKLLDQLASKENVPTELLKDYANRSGMPRIATSDRVRIVDRMFSLFEELPLGELQTHVDNLSRLSEPGISDRSLQGWANIILDSTRKKTG